MEKRPLNIINKVLGRSKPQEVAPAEPIQEFYGPKTVAETLADQYPQTASNIRPVLKFVRDNVTEDNLLSDRAAQSYISDVLDQQESYDGRLQSPIPRVRVQRPGEVRSRRLSDKTFMLAGDDSHLYFFDHTSTPGVDQDATSTFTLERAPIEGGQIQQYDSASRTWLERTSDTLSNRTEPVNKNEIRYGLSVLRKRESKLMRQGKKAADRKERREERERAMAKKELERKTFQLEVGEQELDIITNEQPASIAVGQFLENFRSKVVSFEPYYEYHPRQFMALHDRTAEDPGVPGEQVIVEDVTTELPEFIQDSNNVIQPHATPLGCYESHGVLPVDFWFIAVPAKHPKQIEDDNRIPLDTVLSVSARNQGDADFSFSRDVYDVNVVAAEVTVKDRKELPIDDGLYLIFVYQERRPIKRPPEDIRIVGVSSDNRVYHTDVDVTGPAPKLLPL